MGVRIRIPSFRGYKVDKGSLKEHEERSYKKRFRLIFLSSGKAWNSIQIRIPKVIDADPK
jgi:hypothetical protein